VDCKGELADCKGEPADREGEPADREGERVDCEGSLAGSKGARIPDGLANWLSQQGALERSVSVDLDLSNRFS
jgi:hypothetical protein